MRGGPSVRTHKRPLLAESAAVEVDGTDSAGLAWRLERAATAHARKLKVCVLRYFGVFGGGADWGRDVMARFLVNDDERTTLPSAGAYADVCGVAEAAEAAAACAEHLCCCTCSPRAAPNDVRKAQRCNYNRVQPTTRQVTSNDAPRACFTPYALTPKRRYRPLARPNSSGRDFNRTTAAAATPTKLW